jgi:hypothetical protein
MHDCRKFREEWTDRVIGPWRIERSPAFRAEIESCSECEHFFEDVTAIDQALDNPGGATFQAAPDYWEQCEQQLRAVLSREPAPARTDSASARAWRPLVRWAAIAAAVVLAVGISNYFEGHKPQPDPAPALENVENASLDLDPATVAFLGQSEMYLRAFTKIEPPDRTELDDARARARTQLAGMNERKEAADMTPPLRAVLDEYESVLRDIKNLDDDADEDVLDIQQRIARRGLILDLKTFQPRVTLATNR